MFKVAQTGTTGVKPPVQLCRQGQGIPTATSVFTAALLHFQRQVVITSPPTGFHGLLPATNRSQTLNLRTGEAELTQTVTEMHPDMLLAQVKHGVVTLGYCTQFDTRQMQLTGLKRSANQHRIIKGNAVLGHLSQHFDIDRPALTQTVTGIFPLKRRSQAYHRVTFRLSAQLEPIPLRVLNQRTSPVVAGVIGPIGKPCTTAQPEADQQ